MVLPAPIDIGLPPEYKSWRPHQDKAIMDGLESKKRVVVQVQRQGAGKTVTYMAQSILAEDKRVVILTTNKGLQDQLVDEWESYGVADIRGKSSYPCECMPGSSCEEGSISKCAYAGSSMCGHQAAVLAAKEARILSTNYPCWIASNKYGQGFGHFDIMICDEAHNAPEEVAKAMRIQLSQNEMDMMKREWVDERSIFDMEAWKHWAAVSFKIADNQLTNLKEQLDKPGKPKPSLVKEFKHFRNLTRKLADLATCKASGWVCDEWIHGYQFDPIDASAYAERLLFRQIERVILTSGSAGPKTAELLGFDSNNVDYYDYPSEINKAKSPFVYLRTGVEVKYDTSESELRKLVKWIDRIIESRMDRKGIIHTSNFKLMRFIRKHSNYSQFMIDNDPQDGFTTSEQIAKFRDQLPPAVLVSPSVTTGYDFPYDDCRYQIIAKLPFPDQNSKIERARRKLDPERGAHRMMQSLAQAFGRGDRASDDYQEVFVLDALMPWAKRRFGHLAPAWLWKYYTPADDIPPALEIPCGH